MSIRTILTGEDEPVLHKVCHPVTSFDQKLADLLDDMPEIIDRSGEQEGLEGCLSLPGKWGYVKRPEWVKVKAQDRTGAWFEVEGTGLTARCFCHELSHLDGHLYSELCDRLYTSDELDELMEAQETEE